MKTVTKLIMVSAIALTTLTVYNLSSEGETPFVKENTYPLVSTHGIIEASNDLKQLYDKAALVAEVQIKDQETVPVSSTSVATVSQATIKKVLKGDASLKSIKIAEDGGILDTSKIKGNENRVVPNHPPEKQGIVEVAVEGSTVMKPNQKYIVFLYSPNHLGEHTMVGVVQGKIKVDNAEKMIATVDPDRLRENNLFFLQKEFAGKNKHELESALSSLE